MNSYNYIEPDANSPTILIADDNPVNLSIIEKFLNASGYNTLLANDGKKALELTYNCRPDLVLLDIYLPDFDGFEVCSHIRQEPALKDIPVIFITAVNDSDNKIKGFELGGNDFITKPFQNEEILARIKAQLSLRSMQKQLIAQNQLLLEEVSASIKKGKELLESENRYKQLAEMSPDIIIVHSEGKIQYINPAGIELLGGNKIDFLNKNFLDFIHPDCRTNIIDRYKNALKAGNEMKFQELKFVRLDGKEIYGEISFAPISLYGKSAVLAVGRDISERKKYEVNLLESQERFKNLVQNVSGYIYSVHYEKGNAVSAYHSPQCFMITGYTPEEYLSDRDLWINMVYKDDRDRVEKFFINLNKNLQRTSIEHRIVRKDGKVVWISNIFSIHLKNENEIADVYGFILDITGRKIAEEALQQQYAFLQKLMDSIPNPMFYKDTAGIYRGCNIAFEKFMGLDKTAIIGKNVFDTSPLELASVYNKKDLDLFANPGVQVYEYYLRYADGAYHNVVFNKATFQNPDNTLGGIVGIVLDITELKQIQNELRETLDKLKILETSISKSPAVVFIWRNDDRMLMDFVSDNIIQFGYSPEDFVFHRLTLSDLIYKDDLETVISEINSYSDLQLNEFTQEYRIQTRSGEIRWVDIRTWIQRDEENKTQRYHAVLIDITKRKMAELLLLENKERYKTLADNSYDLICEINDKLHFLYLSPNYMDILGYAPEELLHKSISEIVHLDDLPNVLKESKKEKTRITVRIKHKSGEWLWFECAGKQYSTAAGEKRGVIVSRDITQRKQMEKQLIQSEKMVAIGEMSAMIAHEFRNALTSVKMILQLTVESKNLLPNEKKSFGVAINSIYHMEKIVQQLLTFSHPSPTEQTIENINILIQDCLVLIQVEAVKKGITISHNCDSKIPLLLINCSSIKESIVNILFNAIQSFENYTKDVKRKITVTTKRMITQEDIRDLSFYAKPLFTSSKNLNSVNDLIIYQGTECVLIEIKDNGKGMEEECMMRIFQPFFTTKEKGSGLGLPIVKKNINAHAGILDVKSKVNKGTLFRIYLPITPINK